MSSTMFKGKACRLAGELPAIGQPAPSFRLVRTDLTEVTLEQLAGRKLLLHFFPSLDTSVCATSVQQIETKWPEAKVIHISMDLPFAMSRFCTAHQLAHPELLSAFRSSIGGDYGLRLEEGPLRGLLARAMLLLDEGGVVLYRQLSPEIAEELIYQEAIEALR